MENDIGQKESDLSSRLISNRSSNLLIVIVTAIAICVLLVWYITGPGGNQINQVITSERNRLEQAALREKEEKRCYPNFCGIILKNCGHYCVMPQKLG